MILRACLAALAFTLLTATASVDVRLADEVLVSDNVDGGLLRVEPSAAVHGDRIVVAWNDSRGLAEGAATGTFVAWALSRDGGASYRFGGYVPAPDPELPPAGADSWLGVDDEGRFYLIVLSWWQGLERGKRYAVRLLTMDPEADAAWTERTPVAVHDEGAREPVLDRPAMTVTPAGEIFVVFKSGDLIRLRRSLDGGRTWEAAVTVSDTSRSGRPDSTAVTRNSSDVAALGETVVACWMEAAGFRAPEELWCAASGDRGRSFSPPERLHRASAHMPAPAGYRMGPGAYYAAPNYASLAADSARGVVHLAAAEPVEGGSRVLRWTYEVSDGAWGKPSVVAGRPGAGMKVMASVAVAGDRPHVLYYDQRNAPGEGRMDLYLSSWNDGAWQDTPITTVPSDWTRMPPAETYEPPFQKNAGDYITLAAHGNRFVAVWTDGRDGPPRIWARAGWTAETPTPRMATPPTSRSRQTEARASRSRRPWPPRSPVRISPGWVERAAGSRREGTTSASPPGPTADSTSSGPMLVTGPSTCERRRSP